MADIFISYASADREIARTLGEALAARGYDAWWDRTIPPGRVFDEVIQEALGAAKCVVVLWSQASVASNWVKTEAAEAASRNILVPVMVESVLPPIEFKRIQSANLAAWNGDANDTEFRNLLASIDRLLTSPQKAASANTGKVTARTNWGKQPGEAKRSGLYTWSIVAVAVLLAMGAGALWVYRLGLDAGRGAPGEATNDRRGPAVIAPRVGADSAHPPAPVTQESAVAVQRHNGAAQVVGKRVDILANENGGHVVAASSDGWAHLIDGKDKDYVYLSAGESGVFAFKDERRATFDTFTMLIPGSSDANIKTFELLKGNDSPTGKFESIGTFETQNIKLFKTPYQEFRFAAVTATYLKVRIVAAWAENRSMLGYQFQVLGTVK